MTIASWVWIALTVGVGMLAAAFCFWAAKEETSVGWAIGGVVALLLTLAICAGIIWWQTGTESGKRALKDQQSNLTGGIQRTVTIYDINGKILREYTGRFDIETDKENYFLFDDEDGKRHIIYNTTGTVLVDEN